MTRLRLTCWAILRRLPDGSEEFDLGYRGAPLLWGSRAKARRYAALPPAPRGRVVKVAVSIRIESSAPTPDPKG